MLTVNQFALQALQEYQIRQLVELCLFREDSEDDPRVAPIDSPVRDRRVSVLVEWARQAPCVAEMQARINEKMPRWVCTRSIMAASLEH